MKKLALAVLLCLAWALPALAQGPYVGVSGGVVMVHDSDFEVAGVEGPDVEYDFGYGLNIAGGGTFGMGRFEAEFGYREADLDDIDSELEVMSYMINGYYDMKMNAPLTPYFGLGLGLINAEIEDLDDTVFGYQLTAGVTAPIAGNMNFDAYYRFQSAPGDLEDGDLEISYNSSSFFAGVRYNF